MNITALLRRFANYVTADIRTHVPAQVISFDPNNLTVDVQVAIQGVRISKTGTLIQLDTGERVLAENYNLAPILKVPISILWQRNKGITLPINAGDYGTLLVCDRDISAFKKSQSIAAQASLRKFDLNDSIFLPFLPAKASISDYSASSIDVRYGATKIKVSATGVDITGNLTVSGNATIGGIPFGSHKHSYLNGSAPSTTGGPQA